MEETLITFETAKLAKEKGFEDIISGYYNHEGILQKQFGLIQAFCKAPTQSLLQKWLREVHNMHFEIKPIFEVTSIRPYHITIFKNLSGKDFIYKIVGTRETYEEALEVGLQEGLKLISNEL